MQLNLISNRKFLLAIIIPLILLPLLFIDDDKQPNTNDNEEEEETLGSKKFKCAYVIILMALYWMTEALPLAVTSLLPVVLFPLFRIENTGKVTEAYMKETNMMLIGAIMVALGLEYSNLHYRIALKVMTKLGGSPAKLLLGVMLTTSFLSMWMSNTATCAMMVPVVLAFINELHQLENAKKNSTSLPLTNDDVEPAASIELEIQTKDPIIVTVTSMPEPSEAEKFYLNSKKMYLLAIAYASKIGGNGTITATAPNLVFQQLIKEIDVSQGGKYLDINFSTWMALNIPGVILNIFVTWVYLCFVYLHGTSSASSSNFKKLKHIFSKESKANNDDEKIKSQNALLYFKTKYAQLGSITFHEMSITALFICLVGLWMTRDPGYMTGWASYALPIAIGDSTPAVLIVIVMFIIPKDLPSIFSKAARKNGGNGGGGGLLEWNFVQNKLPWGTVLLLGAGFAVSDASKSSGLSSWIGDILNGINGLPPWIILLITMSITTFATEIISNSACANLILPILITMSKTLSIHPCYLTIPATVACSYAFMFPSASPTSSIVFAAGDLKIIDMVKNGLFLNASCVLVFFAVNVTYGNWLFGYNDYVYADS